MNLLSSLSGSDLESGRRPGLGWQTTSHLLLLIGVALTLVPFGWLACASLKTNADFFETLFLPEREGRVALDKLTLVNFQRLFVSFAFGRSFLNSIFLSSVTAVGATLVCAMAGYALARIPFRGRRLMTAAILIAVAIPSPLLLAPGYEVLFSLGLLNTFSGLILPALAPAFGVYLFRQAVLQGVPSEIIEAAKIDGAGEFGTFFTIVMPLVRPLTGTFLMITFLGTWNNFVGPQVVFQSPEKFPLAVAIAQLKSTYYQEYGLQMAGALVSVAPLFLLFMFLQREFVSGLATGAVKG